MSNLDSQILETWRIHTETMRHTLDSLPEAALQMTMSSRGGRDIARQLAHLYNVRCMWLEVYVKKQGLTLVPFGKDESPGKPALEVAFARSGEIMAQYIAHSLESGGKADRFKPGIVPLMGYLIAHEAQHRGSIFLTMKLKGLPIPEALKWGIWDWGKL